MDKEPILYYDKKTDRCYLEPNASKKINRTADIPYIYLEEDEDLVFRPKKEIKTLYHYCSVETMTSIIQGKNMRLSNCRYSNDSEEMLYSTRKLEELLKKLIEEAKQAVSNGISDIELQTTIKLSDKYIENTNGFSDDIDSMNAYKANIIKLQELQPSERGAFIAKSIINVFNVWEDLQKHLAPIYIACFSEAKDSLSQWWGYGNDGKGVAIGFDVDQLDELKNENVPLKQILYHPNLQSNSLYQAILQYQINPDSIKGWIYHVLPTLKPIGFKEEKEWRLVYTPISDNKLNFGQVYRNNKMHYFYEIPLSKLKISEVVIGPKSELNPIDIALLLSKNGIDIDEQQIKRSNLSYI